MSDSTGIPPGTRLWWADKLVVPAAIALSAVIAGAWFQQTTSERDRDAAEGQAERELAASYVVLSVGILEQPLPESGELTAAEESLRRWAVDVLTLNSPVPLDEETARALVDGSVTLPIALSDEQARAALEFIDGSGGEDAPRIFVTPN